MRRREFLAVLAAVGWPFASPAQQNEAPHQIAIVSPAASLADMSESTGLPHYVALLQELRRLGYAEGHNLVVQRYSGEGRTSHYGELAREVIQLRPHAVLAVSNPVVQYFKMATTAIPIVGIMSDPIVYGFVASLARPGGNITGIASDAGIDIWAKRLQLVKEVVPNASRVAFLASRYTWEAPTGAVQRKAAEEIGLSLIGPPLEGTIREAEYRRVFAAMADQQPDALMVSSESENFINRKVVIAFAEKIGVPAIYPYRAWVEAGGLMAYTFDLIDVFRRAGGYIGQILRGTNPGELPIYQPTKFELIINTKAAEAIKLAIPPLLLARADEVIE